MSAVDVGPNVFNVFYAIFFGVPLAILIAWIVYHNGWLGTAMQARIDRLLALAEKLEKRLKGEG